MRELLSGVIIARNEAKDLPGALGSWGVLCDEVIVVADRCTDDTVAIAKYFGGLVVPAEMDSITGYSGLRNIALDKVATPQVLIFDADERPNHALAHAILQAKGRKGAYAFARRNFAFGRPLDHGRFAGDVQIRMFPSAVRYKGIVHETPVIPENVEVEQLAGYVNHFTYASFGEYVRKMQEYAIKNATLRASEPIETLDMIIKRHGRYFLRQGSYRDGWPGIVMAAGDTLHDIYQRHVQKRLARNHAKEAQANSCRQPVLQGA